MLLPAAIRSVIETRAHAVPQKELQAAAAALSAHYRSGGGSEIINSDAATAAYLAARMPATYAAVHAALIAVRTALPDFAPRSMVDAGAGPGTASLAATEVFASLTGFTLLDSNARLLDTARIFSAAHPPLASAEFQRADLAAAEIPEADLVIAAYALTELKAGERAALLEKLRAAARGVLLIVEPGTPAAFEILRQDRGRLIARGAFIAAPCPHENPCPMQAPDWCHFAARVQRSRAHRALKGDAPFEDEKYSYAAFCRAPPGARLPRVLASPRISKAGATLKLCGAGGIREARIAARDKENFRAAKRAAWGGVFR